MLTLTFVFINTRDPRYSKIVASAPPACLPSAAPAMAVNNQFLRYTFPVRHLLRTGGAPNNVSVAISSVAGTSWKDVRKAPSNYGYDWSPGLLTQGIRKCVCLHRVSFGVLRQTLVSA
jgi:hypothetical protein